MISCHAVNDGPELQRLREQVALLTQRVYRLEQLLSEQTSAHAEQASSNIHTACAPVANSSALPSAPRVENLPNEDRIPVQHAPMPQAIPRQQESLESRIGGRWLNRVGVVAVLIGAGLFLQYAFENHWIGPSTRVLIGLLAGAGAVAWSERVRRQGMLTFSYSMKAVGAGLLYLSLWAGCQVYGLMPVQVAFCAMVLVTALIAWLAVTQSAELLAGLALLGGVLTPVLLSTEHSEEAALFTYLLVLGMAAVAVQRWKQWPRIAAGAWLGTTMLYVAWFNQFYHPEAFDLTIAFLAAFFLLFALAPLLAGAHGDTEPAAVRMNWWTLLTVANTVGFFVGMQELESGHAYRTVLLAIMMLALSFATERRYAGARTRMSLARVQFGLGLALLIVAVPVRFDADGQPIGWLLEAAVFYAFGVLTRRELARAFGAIALGLAALYVLFEMWEHTQPHLLMNERFALYIGVIVILGSMLWCERERFGEVPPQFLLLGLVALNLLALIALNLEVRDYYRQEIAGLVRQYGETVSSAYRSARRSLNTAEDFTHSAVWMLYGVALMWMGFARRAAVLRWQALVLIGATVLKVFFYDLAVLERGYRIASFIVLGAILLGISYVYQKDWLGLRRIES